MMCRTSIFALLAAAMTFAAEGGSITVNANNDSHIGTAKVTAGSQSMEVSQKNGTATWTGWVAGTAYTPTFANVDAGYTARWQVTKSGQTTLSGGAGNNITLSQAYTGCTLSFYGQPNTYTVTLNQEEGSGGSSSVTATNDAAMPPMGAIPTRQGYTFGGYYTAADGGGTQYYTAAGASARAWNIAAGTMLYAKWTARQYTLIVNPNGGSHGDHTAAYELSEKMITGTSRYRGIGVATRSGYTFEGFYDASTGGTKVYDGNARAVDGTYWSGNYPTVLFKGLADPSADKLTVYARWTANTYAVTLDQQSGSNGTSSVTATYDAAMPAVTKPSRTGYTFGGYYSATGGSGTQYYTAAGASARNWDKTNSVVTLYAYWTNNVYTVTLDRQDGSGGSASVTATYGQSMPSIVVPTRTGYTFGGYYTGQGGSGTQYYTDAGASARPWDIDTAAPKLYAKWIGGNNVVTFYTYGGTLLNGWTTTTNYTTGVGLTLPTGEDIVLEHSSFAGWYLNDAWQGDPVVSIGSAESGDRGFYAKWVDKTYNVVFDANGGQGHYTQHDVSMADSFQLTPFTDLATNYGFTAPQGYTFSKWNTATNGTGTSFLDGAGVYEPLTNVANATVTLYAQWEPNPYQVALNPNGADGGETMTNQWFIYDVPQPLNAVAFTYTGHAFKNWSSDTNHNYQTEYYLDGAVVTNLATGGVVNLYANWTGIVYTVSFDANGGEGTMTNMICTYDVPTNLLDCAFTRDGWGFEGWTNSLAEGVLFLDRARVTNLTTRAEEVQMYACWTGVTYAVTLDARDALGRGDGALTNGMSTLTSPYVVGDAWNLPIPTNADEHLSFSGWTYVDTNGVTVTVAESDVVPPPSVFGGATNLVAAWDWVVDPLAAAVDAPELSFATRGTVGSEGNYKRDDPYSAAWTVQTNYVHDSTNAVQSGELLQHGDRSSGRILYASWLTTTVPTNGVLTFWWKCKAPDLSLSPDYQTLQGYSFHFGRLEEGGGLTDLTPELTGDSGWHQVVYTNDVAGPVTFAWQFKFTDPEEVAAIGGTGWVDRVTWTQEGSPTGGETTEHKVPFSWLREKFTVDESTDLETLAEGDSPNGKPMKVWQEYWAGTEPSDVNDLFRANIVVSNDMAHVTWQPDLSVTGNPVRVYHVLCAPTLSAGWTAYSNVVEELAVEVPGAGAPGAPANLFFKVELDWEESYKKK